MRVLRITGHFIRIRNRIDQDTIGVSIKCYRRDWWLMRRTTRGQLARKLAGLRGESLVRRILTTDPKLTKKFHVEIAREKGKVPGLDVMLYPKTIKCSLNPDSKACRPVEMEVKTVEKLFEHEKSKPWPHTRESRFVLKMKENPTCYVFITNDEMTHHTVVDIVKSGKVLRWRRRLKKDSKSPKLPIRTLPVLRREPCPLVSKPHIVVTSRRTRWKA